MEEYANNNSNWITESLAFWAKQHREDPAPVVPAVYPEIWKVNPKTGAQMRDNEQGPFVPLFQIYPPPNGEENNNVNLNLMSIPTYKRLIDVAVRTRKAVLSEALDGNIFSQENTGDIQPKSVFLQPIFKSFEANSDIVGFLSVIIPWEVYFMNILQDGAHPLIVVLKNTCGGQEGDAFSFQVQGASADFLGLGDWHSSAFTGMEVSSNFDDSRYNFTEDGLADYCSYSLHV